MQDMNVKFAGVFMENRKLMLRKIDKQIKETKEFGDKIFNEILQIHKEILKLL